MVHKMAEDWLREKALPQSQETVEFSTEKWLKEPRMPSAVICLQAFFWFHHLVPPFLKDVELDISPRKQNEDVPASGE